MSRHFLTNSRWLERNHQKSAATWWIQHQFSCPTYFRINVRSITHDKSTATHWRFIQFNTIQSTATWCFNDFPTLSSAVQLTFVLMFVVYSRHFLTNSRWLERNHQKWPELICFNDFPTLFRSCPTYFGLNKSVWFLSMCLMSICPDTFSRIWDDSRRITKNDPSWYVWTISRHFCPTYFSSRRTTHFLSVPHRVSGKNLSKLLFSNSL